ncbi:MAG: zinc carboxypeptidase [Oligoflexia bacterium]|nr:zinc carboxypeptidase [Oligoflexia bacterium]
MNLPELELINELTTWKNDNSDLIETFELTRVKHKNMSYPVLGFVIGSQDPNAPSLGLYGGVHGLERIGTHVVISYLQSLREQLHWDEDLKELFKNVRICSIPLINPAGMASSHRSNPNGVDLMRNAPIETNASKIPLVSGHRYSDKLPWYQGSGLQLEKESQALVDFVKKWQLPSKVALSIDFHSGFGLKDRLWYPYGKTTDDFPDISKAQKIEHLLNKTLPYHIYKIEPQSTSYIIEGDLWDYLYDMGKETTENVFIPWTLEMGSWNWVKKNPFQLFNIGGLFNPIKNHRYERTLRRHLLLIDYFLRITRNSNAWN